MVKRILLFVLVMQSAMHVFATADTVVVPIQLQLFHGYINDEQKLLDKADGKIDGQVKVSGNAEINQLVTMAMMKRVNEIKDSIVLSKTITSDNEKRRYLKYLASLVKAYRTGWKSKQYNPAYAPILIDNFEKVMKANIDSSSMAPLVEQMTYETGKIITDIFKDNVGVAASRKVLFLKFSTLYPQKILQNIGPYIDEPFADSLVVICSRQNPTAIYSSAQAAGTSIGQLILRNNDPVVKTIVTISKTPNSLLYFPFLDDILTGKKTIASIQKIIGDGETGYDSVGYFKLLVQTEIDYFKRMISPAKDTPVAMFGSNGLRDVLERKAIQHFINPINLLHEKPEYIRMKAIEPLSSTDLFYMLVMGETEIYTSSYKYSFARLIQRLGKNPRTDSLLLSINFDYFKKFIKMAANFNKLDDFLKLMPASRSQMLMKAFVANLDNTNNLEDAVDVADSYSSITDKKLLKTILGYVIENEKAGIQNNNDRGKRIYGLLKTILLSSDSSSKIDIPRELGIPSIYSVDNNYLADESGRIVQQVFFYGDDDGKLYYRNFINSFSKKDWDVDIKPEWAEIRSIKGKKIWIYANRPLDSDSNLDDSAQVHLNTYLEKQSIYPSIVIHRGHSYWLPRTLKRMPFDAKIILLGSCGGYKNLNDILHICPDAHIISTKEIGTGEINQTISNALNQVLLSGKPIIWKNLWRDLSVDFLKQSSQARDAWEDYIPPYKNLGAIFLKAYNKKMEKE